MRRGTSSRFEEGFTLLELVMAVSLLLIVIAPITSVFWSGLKVSAAGSHRTDAFAIATREAEALHADPYALVGFYTDQSAAGWKSNTTVSLGSCSTTCLTPFAPLILPTGTTTPVPGNTGITYSIARYVYWADTQGVKNGGTSTTFPQAVKGTTVTVSWTDQAGQHTVEQDSIIYPGGQGVYTGPGGAAATTSTSAAPPVPGSPGLLISLTQPLSPLNQQEIDLTITAPTTGGAVSYYNVQWSTDPLFTSPAPAQSPQLPATSTSYAVQGLAAATTYFFRIFAGNGTGQSGYFPVPPVTLSALTAVIPPITTTTVPPGTTTVPATTTTTIPTCLLGAFTLTTSTTGKTYLAHAGGTMSENIVLGLSVNGTCALTITANSVLHGTSTLDPGSPYPLSGPVAGGQWSATIASTGQAGWTVGTHDMTIRLNGVATAVSHGILICAWMPPGQRSASSNAC